jgi:hypothetical protein
MRPTDEKHSSAIGKILTSVIILVVVGLALYGVYSWQHQKVDNLNQQVSSLSSQLTSIKTQNQQPSYTYTSAKGVKIKIYTPASGATVVNPIAVVGEVPGNWSFEASFPVVLKDSTGNVIVQTPAQLLGDWETTQLVPFSVKLVFSGSESGSGTIVLQKDNPSGLSSNDDSISIPIKF